MKFKKNRTHKNNKKNNTSDEEICSDEDDYIDNEDDTSKLSSNDSITDQQKIDDKLINTNLPTKLDGAIQQQKFEEMRINLYTSGDSPINQTFKYYNSNNYNKFQYSNVPTSVNHQLTNENTIPHYNNPANEQKQAFSIVNTKFYPTNNTELSFSSYPQNDDNNNKLNSNEIKTTNYYPSNSNNYWYDSQNSNIIHDYNSTPTSTANLNQYNTRNDCFQTNHYQNYNFHNQQQLNNNRQYIQQSNDSYYNSFSYDQSQSIVYQKL
jgi:hypothetical protein